MPGSQTTQGQADARITAPARFLRAHRNERKSLYWRSVAGGGLLVTEREGRHRYYRLSGPQVAAALEGLAALAVMPRRPRVRSPATEALRRGRTCYDHLAGELGVAVAAALEDRGLLAQDQKTCRLC